MMRITLLTTVALTTTTLASAIPALNQRQAPVCSGTFSNAQCCATDVLGVADLNCFNPPSTPTNAEEFEAICAEEGQQAKCCLLPILGQALVCQDPV